MKSSIQTNQAAKIQYSNQNFIYLDLGEICPFRLKDGTQKSIRLNGVKEDKDRVVGLVRRAEVEVEIDGNPVTLTSRPYAMPTEWEGLRIQVDTTSGWLDIPKRVQFSVWDATDPIVDTRLFGFPLPGYRLFSHGMQAYNEPVHLGYHDGDPGGQSFYHDYGVDFAGFERRQKVVSCIDGIAVQVHRDEGTFAVQDQHGFILAFCHLDSILSEFHEGTPVQRGQWIGMVGKRGASGNFPHLHVGAYLSDAAKDSGQMSRNLNLYPWLVAAYLEKARDVLYAVARPHHVVQIGQTERFDGTHSLVRGSKTVSYRWEFHDGTRADGPRTERTFDKSGCYMAALWIEDGHGAVDVDFCKVKVYSHPAPEDIIPTLFVTFKPADVVRVGQPVNFRIWPQGDVTDSITIDFGDGTHLDAYRPYSSIAHRFAHPGIHIVTASTKSHGMPVTQQIKVIARDE
ncbi:MAG: peptidoglycan DD-metalloendopeptidase family protein [Pirellulales bacterium]|nr:peptidoglycan DD-metalloendopeptidase family protein [Pirellulales bacterium]